MTTSARVVLGMLYQHYVPQSVIDVGCGRGAWLAAAEALGAAVEIETEQRRLLWLHGDGFCLQAQGESLGTDDCADANPNRYPSFVITQGEIDDGVDNELF